jgi:PKD repeat protein
VADFVADTTHIQPGESVQFTNLSENATAWEWYFEGGIPETSAELNPVVLYADTGSFYVKLTVTNGDESDFLIKENYIIVVEIDTVKIVETDNYPSLRVYPNPTTGELKIAVCGERYAVCGIEIFDVYGRKHEGAKGRKGENSPPFMEGWQPQADGVVMDISHLATGIYFVRIITEQGVITKKVVKQ